METLIPGKPKKRAGNYEKQKARKYFKAIAGIELVIGHVKHDHRMIVNYLSGTQGDAINTLPEAAGFNFKKMLLRIKAKTKALCQYLTDTLEEEITIITSDREKQWFFQV